MVQDGFVLPYNQSVEAQQLAIAFGHIDRIIEDKFGRDGEVVLPVKDPMLGIAPMSFCIVGHLTQSRRFFR